jgi:arginase family enzyme
MGGDHSVTLAELRALAAVHGPLGLVHMDSHTDLWASYDGPGQVTALFAANVIFEMLTLVTLGRGAAALEKPR